MTRVICGRGRHISTGANRFPTLSLSNYSYWVLRMEVLLRAQVVLVFGMVSRKKYREAMPTMLGGISEGITNVETKETEDRRRR